MDLIYIYDYQIFKIKIKCKILKIMKRKKLSDAQILTKLYYYDLI